MRRATNHGGDLWWSGSFDDARSHGEFSRWALHPVAAIKTEAHDCL